MRIMDVLKSSYYIRCNRFLSLYGLWPYQGSVATVRNQIFTLLAIFTIFLPHCSAMYELRNNFQYLVLVVPNILYYLQFLAKNLFAFLRRKKIKRVLDGIRRDFQVHTDEELRVLNKYSKTASVFNKFYTVYMFMVVSAYSALPFTLYVIDILMPLNQTRLQGKPRLVTYHVDRFDNNNLFIIVHGSFVDLLSMVLIVGIDTMYMSFSYHACALFVIVTKRVRNAIDRDIKLSSGSSNTSPKVKQDLSYRDFVNSIVMHQFVQTIELAFSSLNLVTIGCSVVPLAIVGFQVLLNKGNPSEMMRYLLYAFAEIVHLFYYNWPGEKIKEHSLLVYNHCYDSNWYEKKFPIECRKYMNLMIARSQKPCLMTAGKIYVLGLENFAAVVKVSMSYLTVLSSIT